MNQAAPSPGSHTLAEILSQPQCWSRCFRELEEKQQFGEVRERFSKCTEWLFLGCGSSYHIALAAAASWGEITGLRARALPASELLLFPEAALGDAPAGSCAPVLISRSGRSSEVLRAADYLESKRDTRTLAVTCAGDQPLEQIASATIKLLPADEESMVMTRSFTSMLLALQNLAAVLVNNHALVKALHKLPAVAAPLLQWLQPRMAEFVQSRRFADYVFLGQGPLFSLACESTLKVTEMSCSYAQAYHTLEFRHGPKAIVGGETLITFLLSASGYPAEREVLREMKKLGGTTLAAGNRPDADTAGAADLLVDLACDLPEYARLALYAFPGQLLGLYTGLNKGLDPDQPRHLSRVVVIEDEAAPEKPEHAAI